MSKREYKNITAWGEMWGRHFPFECFSPRYAATNEIEIPIFLVKADTAKQIKLINVIPYLPHEKDTLIFKKKEYGTGYPRSEGYYAKESVKKIKRLNLTLKYSIIENNKRDTITENFELKRVRGCRFAVH